MSKISYRIAQLEDVENTFNYEKNKNYSSDLSEIENQIAVWNSYYRKEALDHYFKSGWSFLALDENQNIVGFFMGQALLFVEKQTQSLWIEYMSADNAEIYTELIDIANRLSRDKHLQRVLFSDVIHKQNLTKKFAFVDWDRTVNFLKTTK